LTISANIVADSVNLSSRQAETGFGQFLLMALNVHISRQVLVLIGEPAAARLGNVSTIWTIQGANAD
jgi:hypothetical protein